MQKIKALIKNKWVITGVVVLLVIGGYVYRKNTTAQTYETTAATLGQVREEVSITGKVRPTQNLDIAFEKGGRVARIRVAVGNTVREGQELMTLENSDLQAQLAQARANVRSQEAKLDQLEIGARQEDLAVSETRVTNAKNGLADVERNLVNVTSKAEIDLANLYSSVPDTLTDTYTKSDDALRNQVDNLFLNDDTDRPTISFTSFNSQARIDSEAGRALSTEHLADFSAELNGVKNINGDTDALDAALNNAKIHLDIFLVFFGDLQDVVNSPNSLDATTLNTYKTAVSTGRNSIVAALASVNKQRQSIATQRSANQTAIANAQSSITAAQSALDQAQRELALKIAGASSQDIAYQQSQLENARANVDYYQAQVDKTILRAPFTGTVTKIVPTLGDIILPNIPTVSIIGSGKFLIESYVAEADIAKVKVGNTAQVTLDAYGTDVLFDTKLIQIDISSTVLEGVATYKTTFEFINEDVRILPGLTANIDVLSGEKSGVLYIPTRNIVSREGKKYVTVLVSEEEGIVKEVEVVTGLRGSDGRTEIVSGIQEGDKVIIN
ncbi:MAG: RND family efflux transporter MFP subunit [Candidatus Wolfebacteria bacterium GW2011_GWE1_48_7]|uniref:RND family efflux transporter MFP subunit n=2 Tax=Candidatus Wolfeibacteriota TaxID=1752735 RepID=A0A0G1X6W3_9BACT|nr:MAG: efflux transporter, RND family, MFP subunit [Candidatus Wolfebacteria bacterium GW2011_GWB1_47_1]KKU36670.1 MAG: RND family efflux transporter MFP subunit [Candidatus Wolfebacteria bacterium GW2011_GWC2_46_275]KKU42366.1 MAG: RND family efflux transporter MFP subunit [Candidatus Wolfebacteria bacterium GW2011_GWB2_46_69]KKU54332.1 MAG: RND family efflux transporter MFP subunit [Candidatus Wolfebacteria bacterium GW2011_GWC1_47_103]KKU59543.1 MAG: RND family efflux transporter MFP subuni